MRAFISYSVNDKEQFILTLLSSKLRQQGFVLTSSQNFYQNVVDFTTMNQIKESHLFVGVITKQGIERKRVLSEWNLAQKEKVPNLLLIEDSIDIAKGFKGNFIRFNRKNPKSAIDLINSKMNQKPANTKKESDVLPWILGGAALLAIISLLASGDKK